MSKRWSNILASLIIAVIAGLIWHWYPSWGFGFAVYNIVVWNGKRK